MYAILPWIITEGYWLSLLLYSISPNNDWMMDDLPAPISPIIEINFYGCMFTLIFFNVFCWIVFYYYEFQKKSPFSIETESLGS